MFNQLSDLDCSKTTWRVKARVTRMWPSVSNTTTGNDGLRGYNLILLDDNVSMFVLQHETLAPFLLVFSDNILLQSAGLPCTCIRVRG